MTSQKPDQTDSGKAWEYALAKEVARLNEILIPKDELFEKALAAFNKHSDEEQFAMDLAAEATCDFLHRHDTRIGDIAGMHLLSAQAGQKGDVRDIVLTSQQGEEIGISAKHRHWALKHPRLSSTNDFGSKWYGTPCSDEYWSSVRPLFDSMRGMAGTLWSRVPDKHSRFYAPIMHAFMAEIHTNADPLKLLRYVVGLNDFYKVIKANGSIEILSFNVEGSLAWGDRLPLPSRIIEFHRIEERAGNAVLTLDNGWQISFRLHNAEKKVVPTLKFDIQLIGMPQQMARYQQSYDGRS